MTSRQTNIFQGLIADSTLILPVPSLDLFVFSLLNLAFQYPGSLGFVKIRDLEDLGRVKPRIRPAAHDCYAVAHPEPRESRVKKSVHTSSGKQNFRILDETTYISYTGIPLYVA